MCVVLPSLGFISNVCRVDHVELGLIIHLQCRSLQKDKIISTGVFLETVAAVITLVLLAGGDIGVGDDTGGGAR